MDWINDYVVDPYNRADFQKSKMAAGVFLTRIMPESSWCFSSCQISNTYNTNTQTDTADNNTALAARIV